MPHSVAGTIHLRIRVGALRGQGSANCDEGADRSRPRILVDEIALDLIDLNPIGNEIGRLWQDYLPDRHSRSYYQLNLLQIEWNA